MITPDERSDIAHTVELLEALEERVLQRSGNLDREQTEARMNRAVHLFCALRANEQREAIAERMTELINVTRES